MKKTNFRIQNFFIVDHKQKYYLTDIDDLHDWKSMNIKDLKKYTIEKDITDQLKNLLIEYNINSNVNFIVDDFHKFKSSHDQSPIKVIKFSKQKGG
jgi:hypothetical protein